jgi:hypothetical protein
MVLISLTWDLSGSLGLDLTMFDTTSRSIVLFFPTPQHAEDLDRECLPAALTQLQL